MIAAASTKKAAAGRLETRVTGRVPMLRLPRSPMVSSGTIMIVEPDPTVASIWAEVAAYAGFSSKVVPFIAPRAANHDVRALVVRVSQECHHVPHEWKTSLRPKLIALATVECAADLDLNDFDVVLPCDGQVHALYAALHDLAHVAG